MSTDLKTDDTMSASLQAVGSQDGNDSALSISTTGVAVASQATSSAPLRVDNSQGQQIMTVYEGSQSNGNLRLYDADGNLRVQLASGTLESYINNGKNVGIGTNNPAAQLDVNGSFQASGQVTLSGVEPASSAPNGDRLKNLWYDPTAGLLYYQ